MNRIIVAVFSILVIYFAFILIKKKKSSKGLFIADQIKFEGLIIQLDLLLKDKLEFDFFGITSNGADCIYFVMDEGKIQIDYEVMSEEQKNYIEKYKYFAESHNYEIELFSYGNKSHFKSDKDAEVYRIVLNADKELANKIGIEIQESVFKNNETSTFGVVP